MLHQNSYTYFTLIQLLVQLKHHNILEIVIKFQLTFHDVKYEFITMFPISLKMALRQSSVIDFSARFRHSPINHVNSEVQPSHILKCFSLAF